MIAEFEGIYVCQQNSIINLEKATYISFTIAGGIHPGHWKVVSNHLDLNEKKEGNQNTSLFMP